MKGRRTAILLPLLAFLAAAAGTAAPPPRLSDDGYHYQEFADGQHDFRYVEWWYFNLSDAAQGIDLALTYSVLDPENLSTFGVAAVGAIVFTSEGSFDELELFSTTDFLASTEGADVVIGTPPVINFIAPLSRNRYRVAGSVAGGHEVAWDLTYVQLGEPWLGGDREPVGTFSWEQMSWLVYMPTALVRGQVSIDGHLYELQNAVGYHDHNWGEWALADVTWNWAQYSEPGLDLELGDFRGRPVGTVSLDRRGHRIVFDKNDYLLLHTRWSLDPETGRRVPATTWLWAENDQAALFVVMSTLATQAVLPPPEVPLPFLEPVIYEQTATYTGFLWQRSGTGWRLATAFEGRGFKEFTGRRCSFCEQP